MNLDRFVNERLESWRELDALLAGAKNHPERLGATKARAFGRLYRSTAADLAVARRAFPGDPTVAALEQRVGAARHLVYRAPSRRESVLFFFRRGYWQAVRESPVFLAIAAALLLGSSLITGVWAYRDPGPAARFVPAGYRGVTQQRPHGSDLGLSGPTRSALAAEIFTNNIRVAFYEFALGITAGLGTAAIILFNGIQFGAVGGLAAGSGHGTTFFELVSAHGMLELSCLIVAGAAGLRLGWSLVCPGRRTRRASVVQEARRTITIVLGTALCLVVAGLVEGFLTPSGLTLLDAFAIGTPLAVAYWTGVFVLGRPVRPVPELSL